LPTIVRKLVLIGGSHFLSVPAPWLRSQALTKTDSLLIRYDPDCAVFTVERLPKSSAGEEK